MSTNRALAASLCLLLDLLLVTLVALVLATLASGGFVVDFPFGRLRLTSLSNPTLLAAAAVVARYALRRHLPFLGIRRLRLEHLGRRGLHVAGAFLETHALDRQLTRGVLAALCLVTLAARLAGAWFHPGFFSGDDVEIHEMTLSAVYGLDLPVWNLRSPFFPLGFIYPAQRLAVAVGVSDPHLLVFAGRAVVALLSSAAVPLTWTAMRRLAPDYPVAALLAAALVASNKLQVSFGSSELPRPIAAVFVLGAFTLLLRAGTRRALLAGCLLGLAAAFRFSEAIFVVPAALVLARQHRWREGTLMLAAAMAGGGVALGIADYLYWGSAFSSLRSAVVYTVVERASSRGYEPTLAYLLFVPPWTNWAVFVLAVAGARRQPVLAIWMFVPIVALSLLPHKETRYLIPVVPYVCMSAALGVAGAARFVRARWPAWKGEAVATVLPPLLVLGLLQDAGGWRLKRSNEEVHVARWLRTQGPGGVAIRNVWKAGGGIYLAANRPIVDLEDARFETKAGRREMFEHVRWIVVEPQTAQRLTEEELRALGFVAARNEGLFRIYARR